MKDLTALAPFKMMIKVVAPPDLFSLRMKESGRLVIMMTLMARQPPQRGSLSG